MTIINYPDGSVFSSSAQTQSQVQTALQILTAQLLGLLISPLNLKISTTINSPNAVVDSSNLLYAGVSISSTDIPAGTTILSVSGNNIVLSANATGTSILEDAIAQDLNAPSLVRIGWQQQGQPGPSINVDTVAVIAQPIDTPFSRIKDGVLQGTSDTINIVDIYTRTWKAKWMFYGPNSMNRARYVASAWTTSFYVDSFLADFNLFVNPDVEEPGRNPELFQGQWWERVDMEAEFNEQITETLTVGTVGSVEIKIYDKTGQLADFTVQE